MKRIILIICDGMGDLPIKEFGDKTPLEAASTPNMDKLAKDGINGIIHVLGKDVRPNSDEAHLTLFGYNRKKYVSPLRTGYTNLSLLFKHGKIIDSLVEEINNEQPDLIIVDFEPFLCRAGKICDIPIISLDHQHIFVYGDFSDLPLNLQAFCYLWFC